MNKATNKTFQLTGNLAIEFITISHMVKLYCKNNHLLTECESCDDFVEYARTKLDRCVYGQKKPACKHCPIHCYKPQEKKMAQNIMRFSGPRMLFTHPILAFKHLIKSRKKFPTNIPVGVSNYHIRKRTKL